MNRMGLGLAVGAGYLLGRTRKLKMAVAVGSLVAGKKMNLGPRAVADLVNQQLKENPQFKEIGDQLRQDLRGVGKAASGAMVERQMGALADRLHGRTSQVRDQLAGVVPDIGGEQETGDGGREGRDEDEYDDDYDDREGREADGDSDAGDDSEQESTDESAETSGRRERRDREGAGTKAPPRKEGAKKAPAQKTAKKAQAGAPGREAAKKPGKKAPAKKAAAQRTQGRRTAEKTTAAAGGASRAVRSRLPKGGGER
ncbi:PE-PGRS family protein [Streptomyces carpinensis]|uniref:PE-PGRS family protein n=1 Tax=Streptomyces carpinensis TaxID=66369 RepID=A0ABV1W2V5_9ACTN|nr:PE-PGRS family protein [Streptomyces carpinensis]